MGTFLAVETEKTERKSPFPFPPRRIILVLCVLMNSHLRILLYVFLLTGPYCLFAQVQKIELVNADVSEFDQAVFANATRLIGHVIFRHKGALMKCDSAYLYRDENRLEAFHNIRITQGDSLVLTGERLLYEGNTGMARVYDHVILTDRKMILQTALLDYNMETDIASYPDSAHIVDGENTLTSRIGYYYGNSRDLYFKKDVLLVNPRYTMTADTLRYNTVDRTAYFLGPTYIRSNENLIYTEKGWYNTLNQQSSFFENSYLRTKDRFLRGDSVHYDRNTGIGMVFRNVTVLDTVQHIIISGDYAEYHEITDSSWVTGNALLIQKMEDDSLFLHADTLLAIGVPSRVPGDSTTLHDILCFHHVKIYKSDLQGSCDSLVYQASDSTIRFFQKPILWSGLNQMTADSIVLQTSGGNVEKIYLVDNAFIISRADSTENQPEDSIRFNQVRGRKMTGFLKDNRLYRINVTGNGQTIYYAKNKYEKVFAVNRADCSDLTIQVDSNRIKSITLINEPAGTLYPVHELSPLELRLKGFLWMEKKRPLSKADIFR